MHTVLIVDDNKQILKMMSALLSSYNISVVGTAENGYDAITLYTKFNPETIILDVMMPEFDGLWTLEKIREFDKEIKIIMMTASADSNLLEKISKLNPTAILDKPPDFKKIIEIIKTNKLPSKPKNQ